MNRDKFEAILQQLITAKGISKKQLAQSCGISRATLYNILQGNVAEARLSTLIKLAAALDTHPLELLKPYFSQSLSERKLTQYTKKQDTGFVTDVTFPDNSCVQPNEVFTKTWAVMNTGKESWCGWSLVCQDTPPCGNSNVNQLIPEQWSIAIPDTPPGEKVTLCVTFRAPSQPCRVISYWKSIDAQGNLMFPDKQPLSCLVKVSSI